MDHVFFALFEQSEEADEAKRAIEALGDSSQHPEVITHHGPIEEPSLAVKETRARPGMGRGAVMGVILGLALAFVLGPFGLHLVASNRVAVSFGLLAGVIVGALGGLLAGAADPQTIFDRFRGQIEHGSVLLTITVRSLTQMEEAEDICKRNHARLEKRD